MNDIHDKFCILKKILTISIVFLIFFFFRIIFNNFYKTFLVLVTSSVPSAHECEETLFQNFLQF